MATNVESVFHLSQLAYPLLKASGNGSIVFIFSVGGVVALENATIYGATKDKEYMKEICGRTPMRRIAETRKISSLVSFLCLPRASYITGQVICVDGGLKLIVSLQVVIRRSIN
ncbi:NAD(P)-binding Rossmann-fold superfamily protein [Thalictrum thalictroides]|uniref:NAD(P)-binding Rossmann-fold superfamily protein n=1 Tax=Thalictrum thalictroides TaxID=46969 RepID=A0A7J6WZN6_THATH|nr:NAD(P)-binding Rossmann-fold superfamily protein [Thalictrum thalictroides]